MADPSFTVEFQMTEAHATRVAWNYSHPAPLGVPWGHDKLLTLLVAGPLFVWYGRDLDIPYWLNAALLLVCVGVPVGVYGLLGAITLLQYYSYIVVRRSLLEPYKKAGDHTVRYIFTPESFTLVIVGVSTIVPWSEVAELRAREDLWEFHVKMGMQCTVPLRAMPVDGPNRVRDWLAQAGCKPVEPGGK